jgi:hypothetical protein
VSVAEESGVIYCGSCGALNPRANHFCANCGHQLVDAYHASEGLRVYQTPDPAAPLVEIVDPNLEVTVLETDEPLPADFAKIALPDGRIGYVWLREVEQALPELRVTGAKGRPLGCISSTAILAVIALMFLGGLLVLLVGFRSNDGTADFLSVLTCITLVPTIIAVAFFYFYTRKREQELLAEANFSERESATPDSSGASVEQSTD